MGVSSFQRVKYQNEQDATQRDPAPQSARRELSLMDDAHSLVLLDHRNIACAYPSINLLILSSPELLRSWGLGLTSGPSWHDQNAVR